MLNNSKLAFLEAKKIFFLEQIYSNHSTMSLNTDNFLCCFFFFAEQSLKFIFSDPKRVEKTS